MRKPLSFAKKNPSESDTSNVRVPSEEDHHVCTFEQISRGKMTSMHVQFDKCPAFDGFNELETLIIMDTTHDMVKYSYKMIELFDAMESPGIVLSESKKRIANRYDKKTIDTVRYLHKVMTDTSNIMTVYDTRANEKCEKNQKIKKGFIDHYKFLFHENSPHGAHKNPLSKAYLSRIPTIHEWMAKYRETEFDYNHDCPSGIHYFLKNKRPVLGIGDDILLSSVLPERKAQLMYVAFCYSVLNETYIEPLLVFTEITQDVAGIISPITPSYDAVVTAELR